MKWLRAGASGAGAGRASRFGTGRAGAGGSLLLGAVLLVALNLRGAIAAVAPVLPEIRSDLGLSATAAGLLTTLPVLCFAGVAPAAAWLGRRYGVELGILIGCLGIALGTVLRTVAGTWALLLGTLFVGVAMTVGNVLLPVVTKRDFGSRAGTVTGLYTAALTSGAAATAAATAPLAALWGWRVALAVWAALALVAAAVWWFAAPRRTSRPAGAPGEPGAAGPVGESHAGPAAGAGAQRVGTVWRSGVAWAVTLFLGLQSVAYYSVTAWLPTLLHDTAHLDLQRAGLGMSLFQVFGIAGTLLVPVFAGRRPSQVGLGVTIGVGWTLAVVGLGLWPDAWPVWTVVGGVAQGAGISYALTLLVLRAGDAVTAGRLSGMAQLLGYSLGACGPVVFGALYQATGGWSAPLVALLATTVALGASALVAGRNITVRT